MNRHPAFSSNSSLCTTLALVVSIFYVTDDDQCLRLMTIRGSMYAWLSKGIIPFVIGPGQVWFFNGESTNFGKFGEQFRIIDGVPTMPTGPILAPFLAHHVPGLSRTRSDRLFSALGENVVKALEIGSVSTVAQILGGPASVQLASLAVNSWKRYATYNLLAREFYRYRFTETSLRQVGLHYGNASMEVLKSDPYRLLAFAEFSLVDEVALHHFKIDIDDTRRLLGIVEAAVYSLYDSGTVIFSHDQIESAIKSLVDIDKEKIRLCVALAISKRRIVATGAATLAGNGFARVKQVVQNQLASYSRSTPAKLVSPEIENKHEIATCYRKILDTNQVAEIVASLRISVIHATGFSAIEFIERVTKMHLSRNNTCYVIAGTDFLRERIKSANVISIFSACEVIENGLPNRNSNKMQRAILIASSTICYFSIAKILMHLDANDNLIFVGEILKCSGEKPLLFPDLFKDNRISRYTLPDRPTHFLDTTIREPSSQIFHAYDSKNSKRSGTFWLYVPEGSFDRAIVGVSHQLRKHGTVAVIAPNNLERRYYSKLVEQAMIEITHYSPVDGVIVSTADGLEPGDSESIVIILPMATNCNVAWLYTALKVGHRRAIIVSTADLNDASAMRIEQELRYTDII